MHTPGATSLTCITAAVAPATWVTPHLSIPPAFPSLFFPSDLCEIHISRPAGTRTVDLHHPSLTSDPSFSRRRVSERRRCSYPPPVKPRCFQHRSSATTGSGGSPPFTEVVHHVLMEPNLFLLAERTRGAAGTPRQPSTKVDAPDALMCCLGLFPFFSSPLFSLAQKDPHDYDYLC